MRSMLRHLVVTAAVAFTAATALAFGFSGWFDGGGIWTSHTMTSGDSTLVGVAGQPAIGWSTGDVSGETWTLLGGILVEGDASQPNCAGDYNDTGTVDVEDLLILLDGWGTETGDLNDDGLTDIEDLLILIGNWGPCA